MARKYRQGIFKPRNPQKYNGDVNNIVYRSSWELKFMQYCDMKPSILKWSSEEFIIPYYSSAENKNRRYFVDFVLQVLGENGEKKVLMVEIKPHSQTVPPNTSARRKNRERVLQEMVDYQINQDKWAAAEQFAKEQGWEFVVMTEYDLGIKKVQPEPRPRSRNRSKAQNRNSTA